MSQKKPPVASILIEKISFELSKQARVQDDDSKVDEYAAAIEAGEELPPVELYREMLPGDDKRFVYLIGDGWKRIRAHLKQGLVLINAHIYETGRAGAIKHACRANTSKQHGVVRTQADARNAIQIYLLESDWYLDSDPVIARACDVDHKTVASIRERLELEKKIPVTTERRGADGKMYPAKQQKQGGNSQPETPQTSLLITPPEKRTNQSLFDDAEKRLSEKDRQASGEMTSQEVAAALPPQSPPSTVSEVPTLHQLLRAGELAQKERGWPLVVQIPGQKKDHSVTEALTLLPDAEVKVDVAQDNEAGFFAAFTGVKLQNYLCSVSSEPKKEEPTRKPQVKASEGVEDSTPSKKNGESYQHYCSPPILIEATKLIAKIGLDPCHNAHSKWEARQTIDESQDSLSFLYPWADMLQEDEICPLNPPWNNMGPFVDKLIQEAARGKQWLLIGRGGSTAAVWYHKAAKNCALRIEPDKRLNYYKEGVEDASPQDPTVLFYFGRQATKVAAIFGRLGWLMTKRLDPADYADAAEQLRKQALEAGQQGLPFLATPEEKIQSEPEIKLKEDRDVKPEKVQLHQALKVAGAQYQKEGYEVSVVHVYAPRKKFSVMGTIAKIYNREVYQQATVKDESEDAYTIEFVNIDSDGAPICALRAVKTKTTQETVPVVPDIDKAPPEGEPEIWLPLALKKIEACTTREDLDKTVDRLFKDCTNAAELIPLTQFSEAHRAKLPHQDNVKPADLAPKLSAVEKGVLDIMTSTTDEACLKIYDKLIEKFLNKPEEKKLIQAARQEWMKATSRASSKPCPKCHCELSVAPAMRKAKIGGKWVNCPTCVPVSTPKAPAPKRLAGKSEEPIKSPLKNKNNPGAHLAKNTRKK